MINAFKVNQIIGGELKATNESYRFNGVATPDSSCESDVVFLFNNSDVDKIASKLIVTKHLHKNYSHNQIIHKNPRLAMAKLLSYFYPPLTDTLGHYIDEKSNIGADVQITNPVHVAASTSIGEGTKIGSNTYLGANVSIGNGCKIGKNCIIHSNVSIYGQTTIGDNVIIHSNSTIGADGFGYEKEGDYWHKIPQIGGVIIENDVEIGSQTSIDSGCLSPTIIRSGVKIDNHVQISHNCEVKENTVIVSGALIGGSTIIGKGCILAGNVNLSDNIKVGDNVTILARSGVTKDIEDNQVVSGYPAIPHKDEIKFQAFLKRLFKTKN